MGFSLKYVVAFDKQSHEDARRDLDAMHSSARLVDIGEQALLVATAREKHSSCSDQNQFCTAIACALGTNASQGRQCPAPIKVQQLTMQHTWLQNS